MDPQVTAFGRGCWLAGVAFVVAALSAVAPSTAQAQALYYRSIPIGERAIGLGGAFTGVASDPSATYYNPAGMLRGGRFELLGSFSSIVYTRDKIDDAFVSPPTDATFTSSDTNTLPRFVGTVVKVGRKKFGSDHQFALGYSTLEVAREDLSARITVNEADAQVDLRVSDNYRARWYGVSFAAQVTEKSAVGFTLFLSDQRLSYNEDLGLASGGVFDPTLGSRVGGQSVTTSGDATVQAWHFVPRLGWIHRINERWEVGVMFQAPGIPISQKGSVLRRITTDTGDGSTFVLIDDTDLRANLPIPAELRAGFGFQINESTLLSFDGALTAPIRDRSVVDEPSVSAAAPDNLGVYFAESTARRWTPNVAVGCEHQFGKVVVAGGLFTNLSAAPKVPASSPRYVPDQVNMYGASIAVGVDARGYRLSLGATGMFGRGDALGVLVNEDIEVISYERTRATRSILVLYIAGALSVATKGAQEVGERYKARRQRKRQGATEESPTGSPSSDGAPQEGGAGPPP